jgi:hypothetical protein
MELESGSSGVGWSGSEGRGRASAVGLRRDGGACASACRCTGRDSWVDAHVSLDVADHVVEEAGGDDVAGS